MDRAMNPHDGSRRRLKSAAHKSKKDYDRRINKQIKEEDIMYSREEQTENNRLIAEFMGLAYCTRHNYEGWYKNSEFNNRICDYNGLKYHYDWNWIMPVVVECFNRYDAVEDSLSNHQFILNDALLETNINSLYRAVVEFIEWYNTKK